MMGLLEYGMIGVIVFVILFIILLPILLTIILGIGFANWFGFSGLTWWAFVIIFYLVVSAVLSFLTK